MSSILPPDLQKKVASDGARGIGGAAIENQPTAAQRASALNDEPEQPVEEKEDELSEAEKRSLKVLEDAKKTLGITLNERDLEDYLFRGFVTREVPVLGRKVLVKSSQPKDHAEIDTLMMNGDWAKGKDEKERRVSDFYMTNYNAICLAASCLVKFNNESIGETLEERVAWLEEKGSALVDMLVRKVNLFNNAVAAFLEKKDTYQGS